jgi:hypothetical protein
MAAPIFGKRAVCLFRLPQNEYLCENWINRGVPISEVIGADAPASETTGATGMANDGCLNRLKKSVRNRKVCRSPSLKLLQHQRHPQERGRRLPWRRLRVLSQHLTGCRRLLSAQGGGAAEYNRLVLTLNS